MFTLSQEKDQKIHLDQKGQRFLQLTFPEDAAPRPLCPMVLSVPTERPDAEPGRTDRRRGLPGPWALLVPRETLALQSKTTWPKTRQLHNPGVRPHPGKKSVGLGVRADAQWSARSGALAFKEGQWEARGDVGVGQSGKSSRRLVSV